MLNTAILIRRNMRIFFRRRENILFSSLAVIILVALHFLVFRKMYTDNWLQICSNFKGFSIDKDKLSWLVDSMMFAAILPMGAVSISLVALGTMVADKESGIMNDFLVAPLSRSRLMASYLCSSFLTGLYISLGFIAFFEVYFLAMYGFGFSLVQLLCILGSTIGSLIFGNILVLLIISFFETRQALGAVGTILGTVIGFLSGAYMPVSMFGNTVANLFSCLPFLQLTVLSKQAFLLNVTKHTPFTWDMLNGDLGVGFGYQLKVGSQIFSNGVVALFALSTTILFLLVLMLRFKLMKKGD